MDPKRSPQPPLIGLRLKLESYVLCQVIKKLVCFDINSPSPKVLDDSYLFSNANIEKFKYRVSLKKGTLVIFCLSVLEVGFYFFTCILESEFRARFI